MNQLSKESIDFMQVYCIANWTPFLKDRNIEQTEREIDVAFGGMSAGLVTPEIYEKAGLISVEDAIGFARFVGLRYEMYGQDNWYGALGGQYTTAQLFQIYKQQK